MRSNLKIVFGLIFIMILSAVPPTSALGVSGAMLVAEVSPGDSISHNMKVSLGESENPMDLVIEVAGLNQTLSGSYLAIKGENDTDPYSARAFLSVSPTNFHLDPGGLQEVVLEGKVPKDVGDGGRYALVTIKSDPKVSTSAGVLAEIEVPVALTIAGSKLVKTGELTDLQVDEPILAMQQNISLIFKNTGNIHYRVMADSTLKGKNGQLLANASLGSVSSIDPASSRLFEIKLIPKDKLSAGTYVVNVEAKLEDGTILASEEREVRIES